MVKVTNITNCTTVTFTEYYVPFYVLLNTDKLYDKLLQLPRSFTVTVYRNTGDIRHNVDTGHYVTVDIDLEHKTVYIKDVKTFYYNSVQELEYQYEYKDELLGILERHLRETTFRHLLGLQHVLEVY